MANRSSRHHSTPTYRKQVDGRSRELLRPREIPLSVEARTHRVTPEDRLDLIAHRYLADPHQFWRIADANPSERPEDLLERERVIVIPEMD